MRSGVERFSSTKKAAIKSFLVPIAAVPLVLFIISLQWASPADRVMFPFEVLRLIAIYAIFYTVINLLTKQIDRNQYFFQFINAGNWITLPLAILIAPIAILVGFEINTYASLENYAIFTAIVGYILTGYVATQALRIPWQLGAFIAIISLAIHDITMQVYDFLKTII